MPAAARARSRGSDRDVPAAQPRSDVYTGLLGLSLLALITACVFLWLDYSQYPEKTPPKPPPAPSPPAAAQPAPGAPGGPAPEGRQPMP
jgi:hypothetical protein